MKTRQILVIAVLAVVFGNGLWNDWSYLTRSDHETGREARFGNLMVAYGIKERRIVAGQVQYFIATSGEMEYQRLATGGSECVTRFKNGREYRFIPDGEHLYWIDQDRGVEITKVDNIRSLIERIDEARPKASDLVLKSPRDFLGMLSKTKQNKSWRTNRP